MNHPYGEGQVSREDCGTSHFAKDLAACDYYDDQVNVVGFESPNSPEASYNNSYPGYEDEGTEPPTLPPHMQHTLLNHPTNGDPCRLLPLPQNVTLNHLYIENRERPRTVVGLGTTHRFRSKYVTVVLYKPVPRRR